MILFKLFSIQFMSGDDTINWKEQTITIRHNIKLIHVTLTHYPEQLYTIKKSNDIVYNWTKFLNYWNKHLTDYTKAFNIDFNTLTLNVDYSLAPIYISSNDSNSNTDNIYIGIYLFKKNSINFITEKQTKLVSYSFLSKIEPYLLSNTIKNNKNINNKNITNTNTNKNTNTNTNKNTNKYNFIYGILSNNSNNNTDNLKHKEYSLDTKLTIPVKYILQNSMNYLPKLEINRIKMSFQNPLNP
jgi:hypothetical protein